MKARNEVGGLTDSMMFADNMVLQRDKVLEERELVDEILAWTVGSNKQKYNSTN